jgi:glycosyltransferase involved in cell wall biosynthesis
LHLVDGESALVRERAADTFATAVTTLLGDPELRRRLVAGARGRLEEFTEEAVSRAWRASLAPLLPPP